jgi:dihydrofolate reductase
MPSVIIDMSPSLDGYVAGADVTVERPFGEVGLRLHRWIGLDGAAPTPVDEALAGRMFEGAGAVVIGRRMFDVGIGTWGPDGAFERPTFVVTRRPQPPLERGRTTFTFVTDGVEAALAAAGAAAGDLDVVIAGGADVAEQCLATGQVDELRLHIVPVLLGGGTRLFARGLPTSMELRLTDQVASEHALHCTYRVEHRPG